MTIQEFSREFSDQMIWVETATTRDTIWHGNSSDINKELFPVEIFDMYPQHIKYYGFPCIVLVLNVALDEEGKII